jgi:hypothetical protein
MEILDKPSGRLSAEGKHSADTMYVEVRLERSN